MVTVVDLAKNLTSFESCLTPFTSFYMMHVKNYMIENLTAAGSFYKSFPCNIQNLNAAEIIQSLQIFPCTLPNLLCNQNLMIVIIYSFLGFCVVNTERFHVQTDISHCVKIGHFSNLRKTQKFQKRY